ncbi:hypothetical protein PVAP13_3KG249054 [Panicum virgatum]|uniref:Uncharacterized protein n=1 Tax=Panicum virgatum TaxID=38727 RepID=A0A8T0V308_PANVG|nr:hypothetical protein PVAP13_3KG249054 [Panicum virgatum]
MSQYIYNFDLMRLCYHSGLHCDLSLHIIECFFRQLGAHQFTFLQKRYCTNRKFFLTCLFQFSHYGLHLGAPIIVISLSHYELVRI